MHGLDLDPEGRVAVGADPEQHARRVAQLEVALVGAGVGRRLERHRDIDGGARRDSPGGHHHRIRGRHPIAVIEHQLIAGRPRARPGVAQPPGLGELGLVVTLGVVGDGHVGDELRRVARRGDRRLRRRRRERRRQRRREGDLDGGRHRVGGTAVGGASVAWAASTACTVSATLASSGTAGVLAGRHSPGRWKRGPEIRTRGRVRRRFMGFLLRCRPRSSLPAGSYVPPERAGRPDVTPRQAASSQVLELPAEVDPVLGVPVEDLDRPLPRPPERDG